MRYAVLAALILTVLGCELPSESRPTRDEMFTTDDFPCLGKEVIWEIVCVEIDRAGYQRDIEQSSPAGGTFETLWVYDMSPFRFKGRRVKLLGEIEEADGRPGYYRVYLTAWTQRNADMDEPLDPGKAVWQDIEPDAGLATPILYNIQSHFQDYSGPRD